MSIPAHLVQIIEGAYFKGVKGSPRFDQTESSLQALGFTLVSLGGTVWFAAAMPGNAKLALETVASIEA